MSLRGLLACLALVVGLRGGADAGRWPQPVLGEEPRNATEVLLTFDDGPNPGTTPAVLDILARRGIRAVFFLIGKQVLSKHPDVPGILDRIVREGHIIANHTMWHTDLCEDPEEVAVVDMDLGREVIERATAMKVGWFRAPFGVRCPQLDALLEERHLFHFHWDLDPQEWKHGSAARAVKYVTDHLGRATGRNVLLMHDTKQATVIALPKILAWMDEENARRAAAHEPPIRILQAPDLAVERLPPEVVGWLTDVVAGARALPRAIADLLP